MPASGARGRAGQAAGAEKRTDLTEPGLQGWYLQLVTKVAPLAAKGDQSGCPQPVQMEGDGVGGQADEGRQFTGRAWPRAQGDHDLPPVLVGQSLVNLVLGTDHISTVQRLLYYTPGVPGGQVCVGQPFRVRSPDGDTDDPDRGSEPARLAGGGESSVFVGRPGRGRPGSLVGDGSARWRGTAAGRRARSPAGRGQTCTR